MCHARFQSRTLCRNPWKPAIRTILDHSMKLLIRDDLMRSACALLLFALFSLNASASNTQNPAESNAQKRNGQMTMTLSIPLSKEAQDSSKVEALPQALSAKEQEIEELNAQISQMQALIKNLQTSLKPDANDKTPASSVPAAASVVPATATPTTVSQEPEKSAASPALKKTIWVLLPLVAALLFWYLRNRANRGVFDEEEVRSRADIGTISIKTPAYVENSGDDSTGISGGLPTSPLHRKHAIEPAEVDSMIEEAELYAIHGHLNNAMEILNNIILQYPERVEVWLLLLSIFRGNARRFEVIARKFLQTMGRNDTWREIQEAGRSMDPDNPLYLDPDALATNKKPNKRRLLGNILVDMQALSAEDLEKSLRHFDHLRDGRLGKYLVERRQIRQDQLDMALQIQEKESSKPQPAPKLLGNLGRPRPISDVLVKMGAITEPELEHVLADFDPKRHGHCGNYLMSCGLITQKQLHAALLQQLSGVMEDA